MGTNKAERKLGWGGQTLSFLLDSLCLLSHPCELSEERVRLCAFPAGPSCLVQIPACQGFWILQLSQPNAVEAGTGAVCLPTKMPKNSQSRAGLPGLLGLQYVLYFPSRSFVKSIAPPAVKKWDGLPTRLLK